MAQLWRAWQDREVRILAGRYAGSIGRILGKSSGRTVVIGISSGQNGGGRCVKLRRSAVEPLDLSSGRRNDDDRESCRVG